MLKRNDKCSCGSGKKFKNCCMNKSNIEDRVFQINDKALEKKKEKNDKKYRETILKLNDCIENLIEVDETVANAEKEARKEFFNDKNIDNFVANRFFASYFSYDYAVGKNTTPAILAMSKYKFTNDERRIIGNCVNSYTSLFEINKISGNEVVIKDLFTEKLYKTLDAKILGDFSVGDYIIARPVFIDDAYSLIDLTIRIQEDTKDVIYTNLVEAYKKNSGNTEIKKDIEIFVALNSLYFYLYMIQLLELSNYGNPEQSAGSDKDVKNDEVAENTESDSKKTDSLEENKASGSENNSKVEISSDDKVMALVSDVVKDSSIIGEILSIWSKIQGSLKITGAENGWAAGLEYYYRKSIGESITQNDIAKKYSVSTSTLAKRNKDISSVL